MVALGSGVVWCVAPALPHVMSGGIEGVSYAEPTSDAERAANASWATRELRFVPASADASPPSHLTPKELESYNQRGFVLPAKPVLSRVEAQWHGDIWQSLYDKYGEQGNGFSINGFFKRFGECFDLVAHRNVVQLARDTLGTQHVACWGAHYVCKLPHHDSDLEFHQDGVLWPFSATRNCSIWVALDDVDQGNGATEFFAGSHLLGGLHRLRREGDDHTIQQPTLARLRAECPLVPASLQAGFASVHSDLTAHLSMGPNTSDRRRLGITISFCPMDQGVQNCVGSQWASSSFIPPGAVLCEPWTRLERPPDCALQGRGPTRAQL